MPTLTLKDLTIYHNDKVIVELFLKFKAEISISSTLAIVGMSGSGKSLTLKAILKILPKNLNSKFDYQSDFELNKNNIAFIPQNPFTSLSPMTKIDKQFFCTNDKVNNLFNLVGLDTNLQYKFPSQLSGGQLQRVVIAIALSQEPKLLLLDEPTTALDYKTKKDITTLLKSLQSELKFIAIFISHDIDSIKDICENLIVLKNGTILEYGNTQEVLLNPQTSYTKQLITSNFNTREFRR